LDWQREELSKGAIPVFDAENGTGDAMPGIAGATVRTMTATGVDFAHNSLPNDRGVRGLRDDSHEFMTESPAEAGVALCNFEVGVTDAGIGDTN
jgi:hypothetical protein